LQVNEGFPFSIALSWKPGSQNNTPHQTVVFPKGNPIPSVKALTFYRSNTFEVNVLYADTGDSQIAQKISTYTVSNLVQCFVFVGYINQLADLISC
jgi:heat shock 70kDa protein 4